LIIQTKLFLDLYLAKFLNTLAKPFSREDKAKCKYLLILSIKFYRIIIYDLSRTEINPILSICAHVQKYSKKNINKI